MEKVQSQDGTMLAFDQLGGGPPLILVAGASCDRSIDAPIAGGLARHFTVLNYDRRGRGDSGDTLPYAVEREVEDLDALLAAAGGAATVVGLSSGAALAAEAAAAGVPIEALALWEPPFSVDAEGQRRAKAYGEDVRNLLAAGHRGDALARFMRFVGLPDAMIEGMRRSPYWPLGESLAPTLAYDAAVMGDSTVPVERYERIGCPTLVLAGGASPPPLVRAAEQAAAAIPAARYDVLEGQAHDVEPAALAKAVAGFRGIA
jgi:pimeloyl-ACP methyl ester carboxylesterase